MEIDKLGFYSNVTIMSLENKFGENMRKLEPSCTAVSVPWGTAIPETTWQYLVGRNKLAF